jgi:hypothetical protein
MTNSLDGIFDIEDIDIDVELGDGSYIKATKKGRYKGTVMNKDGTETTIDMPVKYVPSLKTNLFSIIGALKQGAVLSNEKETIILKKGKSVIKFDSKFKGGNTVSVNILPNLPEQAKVMTIENRKRMDINDVHRILGHPGELLLRNTAKKMNIELTGKLTTCEYCDLSKSKKTKINKDSPDKFDLPCNRIYVDIGPIAIKSAGKSKYWLLVVDEATKFKWSYFLKNKSDLPKTMVQFLRDRTNEGKIIKSVRLDNAGENKVFSTVSKDSGYGTIKFEFTAPGTPQQNGVVERAFPTLLGRVRAMMNQSGFTKKMRGLMWAECARTATMLSNVVTENPDGKTPYELMYGEQPNWAQSLRTFGEIAVLRNLQSYGKDITKLDNRGKVCMFVGYSDEHPKNTYRFLNLNTGKIVMSRDIRWLSTTWGEYFKIKDKNITVLNTVKEEDTEEQDDDEGEIRVEDVPGSNGKFIIPCFCQTVRFIVCSFPS